MPALILASSSAYRRELLARLAVPFDSMAADIDESPLPAENPHDRAVRLAYTKASTIASRHPGRLVIGSDQVCVCKGESLEKPGDAEHTRSMLQWLSAATATFYTAVAVIHADPSQSLQFVDTTTVYFRPLGDEEIQRYVAIEKPYDCAGGFRCEGLGISLFNRIVSEDPTALIGLPLIALARALRQLGLAVP
jgi:septum formation protein